MVISAKSVEVLSVRTSSSILRASSAVRSLSRRKPPTGICLCRITSSGFANGFLKAIRNGGAMYMVR